MRDIDTSLGGGVGREFVTTQWSRLLALHGAGAEQRQAALEGLIKLYWKPVYWFVRVGWRKSNEDSKDLTQQFFAWLIEGDVLKQFERERGRLRVFLQVALRNFLTSAHRGEHALKRGGGRQFVPVEGEGGEPLVSAPDEPPEAAMDREWRRVLLSEALEQLRAALEKAGKEIQYRVFHDYYFADAAVSHEEVAARYGLTPAVLNNHLADARRRLRQMVHDLVAESVTDLDGFKLEIETLFGKEG